MFYIASKLLAFLIKPIIWVFILLSSALIFKTKRRELLIISLFTFYVFTNGFICDEVARLWEINQTELTQINQQYDVGIVLGGMSAYDESIDLLNFNNHADRIIFAEQLYHQGKIKKILISGGNGLLNNEGYREAKSMKEHLIKNNIPESAILIENSSRNTKENAQNSAAILNNKFPNGDFLLITSANHMRRATFCFDKFGIQTTAFSTDNTISKRIYTIDYLLFPDIKSLEKWQDLIHEWIGYIVYRIKF